jgi:hypothetical protein
MTIQDPDGNKLHICTRLPVWQRQTEEVTSGSTDPEGITPGPTASS